MTDTELDTIEATLGVKLPPAYRRVSREFPFRPIGSDAIYWYYNHPERVIGATRAQWQALTKLSLSIKTGS